MTRIRKKNLLVLMAALSVTFAMAAAAHAKNHEYQSEYQRSSNTSTSLQVTFGKSPHWTSVPGTQVQVIRPQDRPNYDMFHYGGNYYVYDNNRWYRSHKQQGTFNYMSDQNVPRELTRVPQNHWRNYPSQWMDQNGNSHYGVDGRHHYKPDNSESDDHGNR